MPADESPDEVEMLSSSDAESALDIPVCEAEPTADLGMQDDESLEAESSAELTLTEVAEDDDLFCDPNLEVARMAAGEMREIVVPVEVGSICQALFFGEGGFMSAPAITDKVSDASVTLYAGSRAKILKKYSDRKPIIQN